MHRGALGLCPINAKGAGSGFAWLRPWPGFGVARRALRVNVEVWCLGGSRVHGGSTRAAAMMLLVPAASLVMFCVWVGMSMMGIVQGRPGVRSNAFIGETETPPKGSAEPTERVGGAAMGSAKAVQGSARRRRIGPGARRNCPMGRRSHLRGRRNRTRDRPSSPAGRRTPPRSRMATSEPRSGLAEPPQGPAEQPKASAPAEFRATHS